MKFDEGFWLQYQYQSLKKGFNFWWVMLDKDRIEQDSELPKSAFLEFEIINLSVCVAIALKKST
ncbi:MAG TPA: hypothetical protein DD671_16805 [Balneolaceae bacterium]|nr:hypothetical protein [Balneola sp.]HBQ61224.1 hypothetical protein [Balneolaceae bacterium]|tara:strand:+ start:199006 stop:199197 length:192 start_codon:yes stop_codon:yes gene_type:complete